MQLKNQPIRLKSSKGVTLIEVLIAVLVLSVGLLGLGALQGVALQSGQLSYQRTQATNLAYRVADEFRAHRSLTQPPQAIRNQWNADMASLLPNGTLTHARNGDELEITVTWRDDRERPPSDDGSGGDDGDDGDDGPGPDTFTDRIVFRTRI
ncbi:MAG: type IV pilus modification protein PilV [Wenzhouxiangella sp.]